MNIVSRSFALAAMAGLCALSFSVGSSQSRDGSAPRVGRRGSHPTAATRAVQQAWPDPRQTPGFTPPRLDSPYNDVGRLSINSTIEVTNTANSGNGSLRKAIDSANALPGLDLIVFNIPGGGIHTISPTFSFSNITSPIIIDGTTQPGYSGTPLIEINGAFAGVSVNGLTLWAGGSTVRGLAINNFIASGFFNGMGIYMDYNGGNKVEGCFIGTDPTGTIMRRNGGVAVGIFGSSGSNIIGGTSALARNILSGNGLHGIQISPFTTGRNVVQGNYIGLNATGSGAIGNGQAGVAIFGSSFPDTIGGTVAGARNIISGDSLEGIYIDAAVSGIVVQGNYIGTDVTGNNRVSNVWEGIQLEGARNIIGGTSIAERNVLSGNGNSGIYIYNPSATGNKIQGNYIGTKPNGTDTLGNTFGIVIDHATNDSIGSTVAGSGNLISGNIYAGIYIYHPTSTGNIVQGNYIGPDINGNVDLGNRQYGVVIDSAVNNRIGGALSITGNTISGNDSAGIYITGGSASGNKVVGNYIGTRPGGTVALPNFKGILIDKAPRNMIGGTTPTDRNIISGNTSIGIETRNAANGNTITGNYIGVDATGSVALGNGSHGVMISASQDTIGGLTPVAANTVAYNKGKGVYDSTGSANLIRFNSIFSNKGLGIDLYSAGFTKNDSLDGDAGANDLQNFPLLDSSRVVGAATLVLGHLDSKPKGKYQIDFFKNDTANTSHFGEGKTWMGSILVTCNDSGRANFNVSLTPVIPLNNYVTATATDSAGSTSEFSQALCLSDSDADGIMDSWETQGWGIDVNSDSLIDLDLYSLGARTRHKDLLVEVDAMSGLSPVRRALDSVVAAFARVPNSLVGNPDLANGIKLRIDPLDADTTIPVANWPNDFTDFDSVKTKYFGTTTQRASANARYILEAKSLVYRYCIFGRTYGTTAGDTASSGLAELANGLGGNDFMVTFGSTGPNGWNNTRAWQDHAGTFMHEMGHTLGLWHGGNNNQNFKPNYYSVMNYTWQTLYRWQPPATWSLNYSTDSLATLNEASLSEPLGLNPPGPYVSYAVRAVPFTDSLGSIHWARMRAGTAVDWTGNGDSTNISANVDINLVGNSTPTPNQRLNGWVDWKHIVYNFRNSPNFKPGVHTRPTALDPELDYATYAILNNLPPPRPSGYFQMDGLLDTSAVVLSSNGGISLYGRIKGSQLYVATNSAQSQGADMFIFVAVVPGSLQSAPWAKSGQVAAWSAYLGNESTDNSVGWYDDVSSALTNITVATAGSPIVEGVIDLELMTAGSPGTVYLSVGKYQTNDGGVLLTQAPIGNGNGNIEAAEFYQFDTALPIQLSSFTATPLPSGRVRLDWTTLTETNNYGFEIQRKQAGATEFQTVPNSFVPGHGTTIEPHTYSFTDTTVTVGQWAYRLKQIDLDGSFHYGPEVIVDVLTGVGEISLPTVFALYQNYPNPFNPITLLRYDVPTLARVNLKVYNVLGQEVATLVSDTKPAGRYSIEWNAAGMASGVYWYRLQAGEFTQTRKLVLLR